MQHVGPVLVVRERRKPTGFNSFADGEPPDLDDWLTSQAPYAAALNRVLNLSRDFERTLTREQRAAWLLLEEALFEHFRLLKGAYYRIGRQSGQGATSREDLDDESLAFLLSLFRDYLRRRG